jgi:hypothetical protein
LLPNQLTYSVDLSGGLAPTPLTTSKFLQCKQLLFKDASKCKIEAMTSQIELMMERDAIDTERLKWQRRRDLKLRPEAKALDAELKPLNPDLFATLETLERQVNLIFQAVHDFRLDQDDEMVTDEAQYKRSQIQLLPDTADIKERHKWVKRCLIADQIWHCSEEEKLCEKRIDSLNIEIARLAKPGSTLAEHGLLGRKPKRAFEFDPSQIDYDDFDPSDEYYDMKDAKIDELHEIIDQISESSEWDAMSNERHLRKKDQAFANLQIQNLEEYIDQLKGSGVNPNEEHLKEIALLDKQDIVGKTVNIYFTGDHQRKALALRYKEDLQRTKWEVHVKSKRGANKYTVERNGKSYQVGLVVDQKTNHIVAKTFFSRNFAWHQAYKDINGPSSYEQLKAYDLYQWHDKVEKHLQEKKARG